MSRELALASEGWHHRVMARSNRTPERSKLVRTRTTAFARKDRGDGDKDDPKKDEPKKEDVAKVDAKPDDKRAEGKPEGEADRASAETQPILMKPDPKDLPEITPPDPKAEPWPDATPQPMKPVEPAFASEAPTRTREATTAMPASEMGRPPEMPRSTAPPPLALGSVEDPTHMPGPKQIPAGNPEDPAPAPGRVPPGDSRSLRRGDEFALIYRVGTCVVTRSGRLGTRGQWRVVEYPTSASASNSYAKECSRFVSEGFSDYRE